MMNSELLINLAKNVADLNLPEDTGGKLLYSLQVTLVGMGIVFMVLILLMAVLYLFKLFFYTIPSRKKTQENVEQKPEKVEDERVVPAPPEPVKEDAEIAAVIAAAIAAYYDGQTAVSKYKIRSFKRI